MSKTKTKQSKNLFWLVMAAINAAVMSYPVSIYRNAGNSEAQLFAALLLVGLLFVLGVVDTVSIVFEYLL